MSCDARSVTRSWFSNRCFTGARGLLPTEAESLCSKRPRVQPAAVRQLDRAVERVAGGALARLEPVREPGLALRRGAVRPRLGADLPLRLGLDPVIADRRGGIERVRDVGVGQVDDVPGVDGVARPHAGVAVGLEL